MAGGGGRGRPRKTGSTEKRSYKNDVKRQFEAQIYLPIGKWKVRFQRMFKDVTFRNYTVNQFFLSMHLLLKDFKIFIYVFQFLQEDWL